MTITESIIVTVEEGRGTRRYVICREDEHLFARVPVGKVPEAEGTPCLGPDGPGTGVRPPSISDIRRAREDYLGRFSFGCQWLRSMGRVDEMYRSLSTWEVVKVERKPASKVWGR
jgi:hypothetical protein